MNKQQLTWFIWFLLQAKVDRAIIQHALNKAFWERVKVSLPVESMIQEARQYIRHTHHQQPKRNLKPIASVPKQTR